MRTKKADAREFDAYKFDIIYYWVSQKVNKRNDIDYDILKAKIIKNFNTLPDVVEDATIFVIEEQEIDALEFVCAFNPRSISAKQKV